MARKKEFPSDHAEKFVVRFDDKNMRGRLKARAAANRRSMNSEILRLIEAGMEKESAAEGGASAALVQ